MLPYLRSWNNVCCTEEVVDHDQCGSHSTNHARNVPVIESGDAQSEPKDSHIYVLVACDAET
jgi:hypothetical protein